MLHDTRTPTPADVLNLLVDKVVLQRVVTATNKTLSSRSHSPISYDELKLFFGTWMMATCYAIPLKQIEDVGVRGASTVCVPLGCSPVPFQLWPSASSYWEDEMMRSEPIRRVAPHPRVRHRHTDPSPATAAPAPKAFMPTLATNDGMLGGKRLLWTCTGQHLGQ